MKVHLILMGILLVIAAGIFAYSVRSQRVQESFTTVDTCPTSATRTNDGRIVVQPGGKSFVTLSDYVAYLSGLYANGSKCIPPRVSSNTEPTTGILGGLGNGQNTPESSLREGPTRNVLDTTNAEEASATTPINKLDDYEYSRVNQSERGKVNELDHANKNQLLKSRVLDWANLPFNSEERSKKEDAFIAGRMDTAYRDPKSGVYFNTMQGNTVEPPDVDAARLREQKLLAAYRPTDVSTHIIDSETDAVTRLVHQEYGSDPNWEPVVTKVDENRWEVTELRPKARKEYYADSDTISLATAEQKGMIHPNPSLTIQDRMQNDPFFDKGGLGDKDNQRFWKYEQFNQWTPELERMFAPTADTKKWY